MLTCRSCTTFFTAGSCRTWDYRVAAPSENRQSAICKVIRLWLITEAPSAAPADDPVHRSEETTAASTLNEQTRLNRENPVISDMRNRLAFLLFIPLRQG